MKSVLRACKTICDGKRELSRSQKPAQTICSKQLRPANLFPKRPAFLFFDCFRQDRNRALKASLQYSDSDFSAKKHSRALNRKQIACLPRFSRRPERDNDRFRNCPR